MLKHLGDKVEYTKGPWEIKRIRQDDKDPIFWHADIISGGIRVAVVSGIGKDGLMANALLIAHSPELIKAIQDIKSINDRTAIENILVGKHDVKPFAVLINKVTTIAEQIIWKVKGK